MNNPGRALCGPQGNWICDLPPGHSGPHRMHLTAIPGAWGIGRRVVCAAIQLPTGQLILGARHMDQCMVNQLMIMNLPSLPFGSTQGFIDQHGTFMDRSEAWAVACASHQVIRRVGGNHQAELYSENLY